MGSFQWCDVTNVMGMIAAVVLAMCIVVGVFQLPLMDNYGVAAVLIAWALLATVSIVYSKKRREARRETRREAKRLEKENLNKL